MESGSDKIAVLLNANAKSVSKRTVQTIRETLPRAPVFLSRDRQDAQRHVEQIVNEGFGVVLCGGGDGTVVTILNLLRRATPRFPKLGLLKLGTGNAWAREMGAPSLRATLELLQKAQGTELPTQRFDLVMVEGILTHFAGAGWDARMVNDFNDLMAGVLGLKSAKSVVGYMTALFSRTVPNSAIEWQLYGQAEVEVRTLGGSVIRITSDGDEVPIAVDAGTVIHAGPISVMGCASTEQYGFGFRAFPYARRRPRMLAFRVLNISVGRVLLAMPALWRGTLTGEPITDYLVQDIQISFSRPLDFQVGGDAMGKRHQVRMRLADETVDVVDFHRLAANLD